VTEKSVRILVYKHTHTHTHTQNCLFFFIQRKVSEVRRDGRGVGRYFYKRYRQRTRT